MVLEKKCFEMPPQESFHDSYFTKLPYDYLKVNCFWFGQNQTSLGHSLFFKTIVTLKRTCKLYEDTCEAPWPLFLSKIPEICATTEKTTAIAQYDAKDKFAQNGHLYFFSFNRKFSSCQSLS